MTAYAFSTIKELEPDGTLKVYEAGDRLDDLSKERVAHLLSIGAAATYDRTKSTGEQVATALEEQEALRVRVAELEAQLAQATKDAGEKATAEAKKYSESKTSESKPSTTESKSSSSSSSSSSSK